MRTLGGAMGVAGAYGAGVAALAVVLAAAWTAPAMASGAATPYQVTATVAVQDGPLTRTELTVSTGSGPLDRFKMVRVAASDPHANFVGSLLLVPPLGTTFNFYEQRDQFNTFGSAMTEFFALRGFDVYGYSPRYEGIPAGTCEAGAIDCSAMKGWGMQSIVDDVTFVRSQISVLHPGAKVVIGGLSLGCLSTISVVNAHPGDYVGAVTWEGLMYSANAQVRALDQGYCSALQAQLAANVFYDGVDENVLKQVMELSRVTPGGLTPNPLFPPSLTNHQTMVAAVSTPTPGPASMTVPNEILIAGDLAQDRLLFASEPRVYENVSRFTSYAPVALLADVTCSIAGEQSQFTSNLGQFKAPLLAIGGGHAFGAYMSDQIGLFGSAQKTFLLQPDFGHVDHYMTPLHLQYVEEPILAFLLGVFAR